MSEGNGDRYVTRKDCHEYQMILLEKVDRLSGKMSAMEARIAVYVAEGIVIAGFVLKKMLA